MEPLHLSQQALDRLTAELEERTTSRRKEITLRIEEARAHGDLSENAEYDAAKNEQGQNEGRVRQLEDLIKRAVVVEAAASDGVTPGCLVELRYDGDDDTTTYLYGSIEERHDTFEVLSTSSPLGVALLGKKPPARVTYQGPRRELAVELVGVRTL
jgi:transcription elongation factor GreA